MESAPCMVGADFSPSGIGQGLARKCATYCLVVRQPPDDDSRAGHRLDSLSEPRGDFLRSGISVGFPAGRWTDVGNLGIPEADTTYADMPESRSIVETHQLSALRARHWTLHPDPDMHFPAWWDEVRIYRHSADLDLFLRHF